jgi:hypothetical protein
MLTHGTNVLNYQMQENVQVSSAINGKKLENLQA